MNVSLPTWAFASVLPLFVLVLHFDLLHNLHEHASKLQNWVVAWEKKFPPADSGTAASANNVQLTHLLFPFLYDFAWLHANGKGPSSINRNLLPTLCWSIYCWAPYSVLLIFLIRFADLQSYFYTGWHLLLVGMDVFFLYWYWPRFGAAQSRFRVWPWLRKLINLPVMMLLFSTTIATWSFTLYCLIQRHLDADGSAEWVWRAIELEKKYKPTLGLTLVPRIMIPNYRVKLDTNHFSLAEIRAPGKNKAELWPDTAASANLSERRLGFADFSGVDMPRVNFAHANLKGADMSYAQLQDALLNNAMLQGADMNSTQLNGALMFDAELQGVNLSFAGLRGTHLTNANLQGANLSFANLQGANLNSTKLQGADLQNSDWQGAVLLSAKLQGADLSSATIKGSHLELAQLHAAKLPEAMAFSATSGRVDWKTTYTITDLKDSAWFSSLPSTRQSKMSIQADKETQLTRFKESEQRAKVFIVPVLPTADAALFSAAWLEVVCEDATNANAMLRHDFRKLPKEISDTQLRQWMLSEPKCKPYQAGVERILANRKSSVE